MQRTQDYETIYGLADSIYIESLPLYHDTYHHSFANTHLVSSSNTNKAW